MHRPLRKSPYYSKFHRGDPSASSTSRGGWVNSCLTPPHAPSPTAYLRWALLALVALDDELGKSLVGLAVAADKAAQSKGRRSLR